jgi:hypothetical protein
VRSLKKTSSNKPKGYLADVLAGALEEQVDGFELKFTNSRTVYTSNNIFFSLEYIQKTTANNFQINEADHEDPFLSLSPPFLFFVNLNRPSSGNLSTSTPRNFPHGWTYTPEV